MKVAIGVLVLVCVAFLLTRLQGGGADSGVRPGQAPGWMESLDGMLREPMDMRDLRPVSCFDRAAKVARAAPGCTIVIEARRGANRLLGVKLQQGTAAVVDFRPGPGDDSGLPSRPKTLTRAAGQEGMTVVVPKAGGRLVLKCVGTACGLGLE